MAGLSGASGRQVSFSLSGSYSLFVRGAREQDCLEQSLFQSVAELDGYSIARVSLFDTHRGLGHTRSGALTPNNRVFQRFQHLNANRITSIYARVIYAVNVAGSPLPKNRPDPVMPYLPRYLQKCGVFSR